MRISRKERKAIRQRKKLAKDHIKTKREYFEGRARLNRHVFKHGAPPPDSVIYNEYADMSAANGLFENGRQKDGITVLRPIPGGYEDIGVGAYNTETPDFYLIGMAGRPYEPLFPTAQSKKYFVDCIRRALPLYPLELQSYSVLNNSVYFVFASYDQTRVSLQRFISLVNRGYAEYYNELMNHSGTPFSGRPTIKKLSGAEDVADNITLVERQPAVRGFAANYPYCSTGEGENGITSRTAFTQRFGADGTKAMNEASTEEYHRLHSIDLSMRLFSYRSNLTTVIEETLIDFGCFTKRAVPKDIMPKIIAEVSERSRAPFKKIAKKMGAGWRIKYDLLAETIAELIKGSNRTFDYAWRVLYVQNYQKRPVAIDVAILLFEQLGYSIDQIFNMMGFAYSAVIGGQVQYYNDKFLCSVMKDYALEHNIPMTNVIELFGIRNTLEDPNRVRQVAAYFMQ